MAKKISAMLAAVLLFVCVFTACGNKNESKSVNITGTWSAEVDGVSVTYEFKANGTGTAKIGATNFDLTYTIEEDVLTIVLDGTALMEEIFGMGINEILGAGLITQGDLNSLYETIEAPVELGGNTLKIGDDVFTKVS